MEMGIDFDWGQANGHRLWQMKILVRKMEIRVNHLHSTSGYDDIY